MSKKPVVITIGYQSFFLTDDTGVSSVVRTLSSAYKCSFYMGGKEVRLDHNQSVEISMQYVPRGTRILDESGSPIVGEKSQAKPLQKPKANHGLRKLQEQHVHALKWNNDPQLPLR